MSNKKQTAVDWQHEKVSNMIEQLKRKYVNQEEFLDSLLKIRNQAKEMERQQIIDAYHTNPLEAKWKNIGSDYYNETYNNCKTN